jgi:hypothetical protein
MILSQIKTPFAVGDVCVKVGSAVRVLSGQRYFCKQEMFICKFHLILRRAGRLAVTRGMRLEKSTRAAGETNAASHGRPSI